MVRRARWLTALCAVGLLGGAGAPAPAAVVDGISDQGLPAWDGAFQRSPLAAVLRDRLIVPAPQLRFARYVLQWDALQEGSRGADPHGDYRERFEAWLDDVRELGLVPVLALTSYDGTRPGGTDAYAARLTAALGVALARGIPIAYVEPWNEPNNQGRESAAQAATQANAAHTVCLAQGCQVIAGDVEDAPGSAAYVRAYAAGLAFRPRDWGVHPYRALAHRSPQTLQALRAALPDGGAGAQLWVTEIAAFYCRAGQVRGERAQAAEAAYLRDALLADGTLAIAHAFYYGLLGADGRPVPCTGAGGGDGELYAPGDRPRPAAAELLPTLAPDASLLFGPGPLAAAAATAPGP